MLRLKMCLSEASVIAAKMEVRLRQCRVVAGVFEKSGAQFAFGRINAQHRDAAIREAAWIDAENDAARRKLAAVHCRMGDA